MSDLVAFVLARLAEDEAGEVYTTQICIGYRVVKTRVWRETPGRRWLADCKAKRRIVELHRDHIALTGEPYWSPELRAVGEVWDDHPDYDEAWRL